MVILKPFLLLINIIKVMVELDKRVGLISLGQRVMSRKYTLMLRRFGMLKGRKLSILLWMVILFQPPCISLRFLLISNSMEFKLKLLLTVFLSQIKLVNRLSWTSRLKWWTARLSTQIQTVSNSKREYLTSDQHGI